MRKETARLLTKINETLHQQEANLAQRLTVNLRVCNIEDEDPGIRYHLTNGRTPIKNTDGHLKLSRADNPLFPRRQARKAEGIALEAYTYFSSKEQECHIHHYPLKFLA